MLCDAADAAAGMLAGRAGYLPKVPTVLVTGTALVAVGLGAAALANDGARLSALPTLRAERARVAFRSARLCGRVRLPGHRGRG